jgi:hypothetical protein
VATEEDRQEERDRMGNDPSAPGTEHPKEEDPLERPAEGEDPDTAAHERQEHEHEDPERQEQREAQERGSGRGAV